MIAGRRWTVRDRGGREIYLTEERWKHITDPHNHPEMAAYEEQLRETIRNGIRQQDSLNPLKYRYVKAFDDLTENNTHVVAIVLFRFSVDEANTVIPNNYLVTAYQKAIR
ncbi:MAG: hypothetical protein EXR78_02135 [Deltaproteobacteria bacterium]|nr:hypothetical protein [Deltaproteobacteria bacterium]